MPSYTNARPGASLLAVDLGTRYPYGSRSGQGVAQTLKALHLEAGARGADDRFSSSASPCPHYRRKESSN